MMAEAETRLSFRSTSVPITFGIFKGSSAGRKSSIGNEILVSREVVDSKSVTVDGVEMFFRIARLHESSLSN